MTVSLFRCGQIKKHHINGEKMKDFIEFLNKNKDYSTQTLANTYRYASSLLFYLGVIKVVNQGSRLAKRAQYSSKAWAESSYNIFRHIEACGGRFYIRGLGNLHEIKKNKQPVVFVANHMSTLETFILPILLLDFTPVTFVIKRELTYKYPWLRDIMKAVNPICVNRTNPREDYATVLEEGINKLANRTSVIIFPQTTRSDSFDPKEFNSIGLKLAKKANVPIVPIALKTDFWGNGKIIKDVGPIHREKLIHFYFGPVHSPNEKNTQNEIVNFIADSLAMWSQ